MLLFSGKHLFVLRRMYQKIQPLPLQLQRPTHSVAGKLEVRNSAPRGESQSVCGRERPGPDLWTGSEEGT